MSDLEEILISPYASEINASISWIRDGDIDVELGDPLNGYKAEGKVGTFPEAAERLCDQQRVRQAICGQTLTATAARHDIHPPLPQRHRLASGVGRLSRRHTEQPSRLGGRQ